MPLKSKSRTTIERTPADRLPRRRPPTHPGEMLLEEFIRPLGLTQTRLAACMGVSYPRLNEVIKGRRSVTPDTALRLARARKRACRPQGHDASRRDLHVLAEDEAVAACVEHLGAGENQRLGSRDIHRAPAPGGEAEEEPETTHARSLAAAPGQDNGAAGGLLRDCRCGRIRCSAPRATVAIQGLDLAPGGA